MWYLWWTNCQWDRFLSKYLIFLFSNFCCVLNVVCFRFGTLCLFHLHRRISAYEDGTECSKTSAYKIQTPVNYPEESIKQCLIYFVQFHSTSAPYTFMHSFMCHKWYVVLAINSITKQSIKNKQDS
jgi:hypothetical protein